MSNDWVYVSLPDRALITVSGKDRVPFLQGLITQDITLLAEQSLIHSCLLTPQGKFQFDFFIFDDGDSLVLDCEGGERAQALLKRLVLFKLRSDVALEVQDQATVWQVFSPQLSSPLHAEIRDEKNIFKDPRHDAAGYRVYDTCLMSSRRTLGSQIIFQQISALVGMTSLDEETSFNTWDHHRITLGIPDGSRDMIPDKSFLHESAILARTAVSYTKGCYMGQELVSRMHHRGLIKKQLQSVPLTALPEGAELRSHCGEIGLALIRL